MAVNGLFCALVGHGRHHPDTELAVWLSQRDCQAKWGRVIQAHGLGRWRDHRREIGFFLHHHPHQRPVKALIGILAGYDTLAQAIPRPPITLLVWLSRPDQETDLHRLVPPRPYLVATATPDHGTDSAEAIWRPLGSAGPRYRLADLAHHQLTRSGHEPRPNSQASGPLDK